MPPPAEDGLPDRRFQELYASAKIVASTARAPAQPRGPAAHPVKEPAATPSLAPVTTVAAHRRNRSAAG